jgi:hypothetical protein
MITEYMSFNTDSSTNGRARETEKEKEVDYRDAEGLEKAIITGSGAARVGWGSF